MAAAARVAEFFEGFGFDLTDAFAGHEEMAPHLFERLLTAVFEPEAHHQHLAFAQRQIVEAVFDLFAQDHVRSGFGQQYKWLFAR